MNFRLQKCNVFFFTRNLSAECPLMIHCNATGRKEKIIFVHMTFLSLELIRKYLYSENQK